MYSIASNIQKQKYRLIRNALAADSSTKIAADSLLMRAVRNTGGEWFGGETSIRGDLTSRDYWSRSLVEELQVGACSLKINSALQGNILDTPLSLVLRNWNDLRVELEKFELVVVGDIVQRHEMGGWQLIPPKTLQLSHDERWELKQHSLLGDLRQPGSDKTRHLLRPGQIWMQEGAGFCDEILGWNMDHSQYCIKRWRLVNPPSQKAWRSDRRVWAILQTRSQGAGSDAWEEISRCQTYSYRVVMGRDICTEEGKIRRLIVFRTSSMVGNRKQKVWEQDMRLEEEVAETICTDGSWCEDIVSPGVTAKHRGGCGVVILEKGTRNDIWRAGFRMTTVQTPQRAFTMEMIAAAIGYREGAKRNRRFEIHTDCKSAIVTFGKGSKLRHHHSLKMIVRAVRGIYRRMSGCPITSVLHWVQGHPEDRGVTAAFSPVEYGNHVADSLAEISEGNIASVEDALRILAEASDSWEMWQNDPSVPMLLDPFTEAQTKRLHDYLLTRHESRGAVTKEELLWLRTSRGSCSQRQWGAWLKLIMRRFNRDMPHAEPTRCPCTWGDISVEHFRVTCKEARIIKLKETNEKTVLELSGLLPHGEVAGPIICGRIAEENNIWRGQWTTNLWEELERECGTEIFEAQYRETLMEITFAIVSMTLECFSTVGQGLLSDEQAWRTQQGVEEALREELTVPTQRRAGVPTSQQVMPGNTVRMRTKMAAASSQKITDFFSVSQGEDGD